jgi:hypothetical protein
VRTCLIAVALVATLMPAAGCASAPDVPGAVTFQTRADPMVGGFCSHFVESEPAKPCLDGVEKVLAAHPDLAGAGTIEITATVTRTSASRSNAANPPQTETVVVWVIDQVASVRKVS